MAAHEALPGMTPEAIHRAAPAKLNLYLHVVGRRADGYHLVDSLVAFAGVHDTVSAVKADALTLALAGPFGADLSGEADNLVLRAARALADAAGVRPHAALRLVKRLPVAAGIGGGSADAAATLAATSELWRITHKPGALAKLALKLGADVPVCLAGKAAQVSGIGEKVAPAPALPRMPLVLVNPRVPLPTPAVFKARRGAFSQPAPLAAGAGAPRDARDLAEALASRRNDLTDAAIGLVPEIATVLAALEAQPGCLLARMSGSGATCFALFARAEEAAAAAGALRAAKPGWWTQASALVGDTAEVAPLPA